MYINVGAYIGGARPKSKKALKEALKSNPASVLFDHTSFFDGASTFRGDEIPEDATLSVCGPNPYVSRKWWADIRIVNGCIRVT